MGGGACPAARAAEPASAPVALDERLDAIAPAIRKWASVCVVTRGEGAPREFRWHSYRDTAEGLDFWPASTIKLYAVIAALELLHSRGFPLETVVIFEHREKDGTWVLDC